MSTPNRTARKPAAIDTAANKVRTSADKTTTHSGKPVTGSGTGHIAKPALGHTAGNKGVGSVYEAPKPVRPKPVKK